jgi:hypothetical protein
MGVKSTITLTREEAEKKYAELKIELSEKRRLRSEACLLEDIELENILEEMNDMVNDGEGFENYSII